MRPLVDVDVSSNTSGEVPYTVSLSKPRADAASVMLFASLFGCTDFHEVRHRQGKITRFSP